MQQKLKNHKLFIDIKVLRAIQHIDSIYRQRFKFFLFHCVMLSKLSNYIKNITLTSKNHVHLSIPFGIFILLPSTYLPHHLCRWEMNTSKTKTHNLTKTLLTNASMHLHHKISCLLPMKSTPLNCKKLLLEARCFLFKVVPKCIENNKNIFIDTCRKNTKHKTQRRYTNKKKGIVHCLPQAIKFPPSRCKYVQKSQWGYFIKGLWIILIIFYSFLWKNFWIKYFANCY